MLMMVGIALCVLGLLDMIDYQRFLLSLQWR